MTIRLNQEIRKEMLSSIQKDVASKLEKSALGKELAQVLLEINDIIKELINKKYPIEDIEVLRKYGLVSTVSNIGISCSISNKKETYIFNEHSRYNILLNKFTVPYLKSTEACTHLNENIPQDNREYWFKCYDKFACEKNDIMDSYKSVLGKIFTVKQLKQNFPQLVKYLPKIKEIEEPRNVKDSLKVIQLFEAEKN